MDNGLVEMKKIGKFLLNMSSFIPLYIIIMITLIFYNNDLNLSIILTIIYIMCFLISFSIIALHKFVKEYDYISIRDIRVTIENYKKINKDIIANIIIYIGLIISIIIRILSSIIFLQLLFFIIILVLVFCNVVMVKTNPMIRLMGYKFFALDFSYKDEYYKVILVCKNYAKIETGSQITVRELDRNFFMKK